MENEALHIRYLIGIAAILCAVIIGYNLFFVPDAAMTTVVYTDSSSSVALESAASAGSMGSKTQVSSSEEYTPLQGGKVSSQTASKGTSSKAYSGKVNINIATVQQLDSGLPEIGTVMAKRIVDYREKNGSFKTIEDIKKVSGIGDKTFEKLRDYITLN